jgi:hypothetical protein
MALVPPPPLNRPTIRFRLTATVKHGNLARNRFDCPDDGAEWSMRRATFTIAVAFLCSLAATEQPPVTFVSPCECQGFHGKHRWVTNTNLSPVPLDKSAIQSVTPSQIYQWEGLGPDVVVTGTSEERLPAEQKWYALTGRVVDLKVEADGDIHLALQNASGIGVGTVSTMQTCD